MNHMTKDRMENGSYKSVMGNPFLANGLIIACKRLKNPFRRKIFINRIKREEGGENGAKGRVRLYSVKSDFSSSDPYHNSINDYNVVDIRRTLDILLVGYLLY